MKTIRGKLMTAFALLICILVAINIMFVTTAWNTQSKYKTINNNLILEGELKNVSTEVVGSIDELLFEYNEASLKKYNEGINDLNQILKFLNETLTESSSKAAYNTLSNITTGFIKDANGCIEALKNKNLKQANILFQEINVKNRFIQQRTNDLISIELKHSYNLQQALEKNFNMKLTIGIILLVAASLFGIGFATVFSGRVKDSLMKIVEATNEMSKGNLAQKLDIESNDETKIVGDNFNKMIENVSNLIEKTKAVSGEVNSAGEKLNVLSQNSLSNAKSISEVVAQIATGASEQAADTQKGADLTSQIQDKFEELVKNSDDMSEQAKEIVRVKDDGIEALDKLKIKTIENNKETKEVAANIEKLNDHSKNISNIIETITSISEQTNLLALNASIEAARAGEYGKGFAVVADEIRKLAEESDNSTKDIQVIISGIQNEIRRTVDMMNNMEIRSGEQNESVEHVSSGFESISNSIDNIRIRIENLNNSIMSIDEGNKLVVDSISSIASVSEESAAASEEVSASVDEQFKMMEEVEESTTKLNELTEELNTEINKFKLT
ncbi:methyl-accepting chemotaxis protein [Clostridium brassicae]|uniref:Methyl-accepting chemotaxis protein n=1 Tax=Clostridium brassicae TaxID=2999072 RepID=A0ABT4DDM8_9CLOT|nr:methyl-accepting chemotaxis protein [Clostridium brassicae]MCY6960397.1 methyl-accepting chemotaxis protein [Clostridium brassicae]